MKKRLLFAFMAMCVAVSGFALEKDTFVYTPQGRFQITGDNVNANNTFQNMDGWTVVSASAEKTLADIFNINANGYADGINSVASLDATAGEGMYFKFEPTDASTSYVVSYKIKGATAVSIRTITTEVATNLVKVAGNAANTYTYPSTEEEVVVNTAEELTEDWQTFNYAIVGDGTARTYFISFTGMATNIEIADLQIAPAMQFADLRQRDAMLEKLNVYKNCYKWDAALLADMGYDEAIEGLQAIGDESGQDVLNEALTTAKEIFDEFLKANMDDYLAGNGSNYLGIKETSGNTQKVSTLGDWNCLPSGRGFWSSGAYPDMGHYQQSSKWCGGSPDNPMGVYMQKTLDPGSYVFAIEGNAAVREPKKQCWTLDEGTKPAYGVAYIVKVVDGVAADTIKSVVKDLEPVNYTPFYVDVKIDAAATYEIGFKAYCKDTHKDLTNGSVVYVKDASIWGKNDNKYNQKQLGYEADVREQITTGRTQLTTAKENIANADYFWGKTELQACVDSVETKIAQYELLDQDAIIATYEEDYAKSTSAETGYLVYTIYQEAVKDIIAANKKFTAVNDTLATIQTAIDNAELVKALRLYDAATGKDALQAAIDKAKGIQAQMKATQYSEEKAAAIVAANAELAEAVEAFKNSVPASAIATIVDIDFEKDAVLNDETGLYSVSGAAGSMEFSHFSATAPADGDSPYQQGHWSNGEQLWKGYLRVGNGTGTVLFDPKPAGDEGMGTNILKVSCDFFIQGLNNRSIGFLMENANDSTVCGMYRNYYNGTTTTNTFNADESKIWAKSGGTYNDASPRGAEGETANPLEKTSFEVVMDYGLKTAYCTVTSINGTATSTPVAFSEIPVKFILKSDYDNTFATRRCWFDNLKIQRITAGAPDPSAIETVKAVKVANDAIYNLAGQKVGKDYKGLVIKNGRKMIQK